MDRLLAILEKILYTDIIKNINLYTLISSLFKYIFVLIVLRFIYLIVRMIYLDISSFGARRASGPYLRLLNQRDSLSFHVENEYPLEDDNIIGKDKGSDIAIDYIYLSKKHARIFKKGAGFYLEDLGSVNGTRVNGKDLKGQVALRDKDLISFVKLEFIFMEGDQDAD